MFEARFQIWLDEALKNSIPKTVRAFAFNLFEVPVSGKTSNRFAVELIGASHFSQADTDWPCTEVFEFTPRSLEIPNSFSGSTWQECLDVMTRLTVDYIGSNSAGSAKVRAVDGVGIGFVDGDLRILYEQVS